MKIIVNTGYNTGLALEVNDNAEKLMMALAKALPVKKEYVAGDYRWILRNTDGFAEGLEIQMISDEAIMPPTETYEVMAKRLKEADNKWLEHYNRANAAENEIKELKEKLESLTNSVKEVANNGNAQ